MGYRRGTQQLESGAASRKIPEFQMVLADPRLKARPIARDASVCIIMHSGLSDDDVGSQMTSQEG